MESKVINCFSFIYKILTYTHMKILFTFLDKERCREFLVENTQFIISKKVRKLYYEFHCTFLCQFNFITGKPEKTCSILDY